MKQLYLFILALLPFTLNAQYPLISLDTLQRVSQQQLAQGNDASPYLGDTVQFQGVVSFDPCLYALSQGSRKGTFVQTNPTQPWAGIHVLIDPAVIGYSGTLADLDNDTKFHDNFKVGNEVRATGIVTTYQGLTQIALLPISSSIQSISSAPTPKVMPIDSFNKSDGSGGQLIQYVTGEPNESLLIELQDVTVVDVAPSGSRWYWKVQDDQGNKMEIRDVSGWFRNDNNDDYCVQPSASPVFFTPPSLGAKLSYIRGIVFQAAVSGVNYFFIMPRDTNDIGPIIGAPPVISDIKRNPAVATSSQTVNMSAKVDDPDGTIQSAELFYSFGQGNTSFTKLTMSAIGNDRYQATIPATGLNGQYVNYWFRAIDNTTDTTDFPFTNATTRFYLTLDDGIDEISDIQETPNQGGGSIWSGDSIANMSIHAVVTATLNTYDLGLTTIQDSRDPWSGIMIQKVTGDGLETLLRGDSIEITSGEVLEEFGVTYLRNVTFNHLGTGTIPAPITTLDPDSLDHQVFNQAEAYESMFVRFAPASIVSTNADAPSGNFGEFVINADPGDTTGLRVDDYSANIPFGFNDDSIAVGQQLAYVQGILWFSFGDVKLVPRNLDDMAGFSTTYPKSINTFVFLGLNPQLFMDIDEPNKTITNTPPLPAGTDVSALVPTIDFTGATISPASGVAQDFTTPVDYTVTAPIDNTQVTYTVTVSVAVGIEETMSIAATLFPNPANGQAYLLLRSDKAEPVTVEITNLLGQVMRTQQVSPTSGLNTFALDVQGLQSGVYLVTLANSTEQLVKKLQITK